MSRCYSCNKFAALELCDSCFYAMNPVVTNREIYERNLSDVVNRSSVMTVLKAFRPEPIKSELALKISILLTDIENEIDKLV